MVPYLVEIGGNKEDEMVNRLFAKNDIARINTKPSLKNHFNIQLPFCLVGLRIPFKYIETDSHSLEGDIDVFFVQLTTTIKKYFDPICIDLKKAVIHAFEVKTGFLNSKKELKSSGLIPGVKNLDNYSNQQKGFRKQAKKLCKLGFNQVALMYTFATTPHPGKNLGFNSWAISSRNITVLNNKVQKLIYTGKNDEFSTFFYSIGSVPNREEHMGGVLSDFKFSHKTAVNPIRNDTFQRELKNKIEDEFPFKIDPNDLPILFLACKNNDCRNLYLSKSDPYKKCPACGSKPRCKYFP